MKILVDVNLTIDWVRFFAHEGIEAQHWTQVGDPRAEDTVIMSSIFQIRTQVVLPAAIGANVIAPLRAHAESLEKGAVIVVDERGGRVRSLPIRARS